MPLPPSPARQGLSILLYSPSRRQRWSERRDLKNCILYSITKLSRRLVSFYNSKRIHAATRTTAPRSIDPLLSVVKQGKGVWGGGGGRDRGMHKCDMFSFSSLSTLWRTRANSLTLWFQKIPLSNFVSDFVDRVPPTPFIFRRQCLTDPETVSYSSSEFGARFSRPVVVHTRVSRDPIVLKFN